jgi:putative sigma-54 modulation protein
MNIIYSGKTQEFDELQNKKLGARFAKVSKMVDGRGEKELHVMFSSQRHLTKAEVTLNYYGHSAVGIASEPDPYQALAEAVDKLEKQVSKVKSKWRDTKRNGSTVKAAVATTAESPTVAAPAPRINRVQITSRRKPMTVDEAILVIGKDGYLPFRDAETGSVSVLIRRVDGHFDLVEG